MLTIKENLDRYPSSSNMREFLVFWGKRDGTPGKTLSLHLG